MNRFVVISISYIDVSASSYYLHADIHFIQFHFLGDRLAGATGKSDEAEPAGSVERRSS